MTSIISLKETNRGFAVGKFIDRYGAPCSIQKSSIATEDCIWLGIDNNRMHLTQDMAAALVPLLQTFVATGELGQERQPDDGLFNGAYRDTDPAILDALKAGRDLIEEAMHTHIYDESNGEIPPADCPYAAHVRLVDELLTGAK
ncbi:hypothetical protein MesoLjLc_51350 [Mesorhizobium sp. L-8-10]|uniref:hypothetical protein n=1 Tax=Mesorhizobium sp. L-8-10 TaxID=2744523 RepID=UPI0019258F70|nr:hypothetical protein [Mesorhizobium sp. L-8-10]BCH33205.1 hypothetical protein MesoLjLc_51350 [Mesorhizobium sp. L-8-10]